MSNILPVDSSYLLIKPIHASAELRYIKLATPEDSLLQWPYKSFFMPVSSLADAECIVLAARRSLFNSDGPYLAGNGSYNSGISPKI